MTPSGGLSRRPTGGRKTPGPALPQAGAAAPEGVRRRRTVDRTALARAIPEAVAAAPEGMRCRVARLFLCKGNPLHEIVSHHRDGPPAVRLSRPPRRRCDQDADV